MMTAASFLLLNGARPSATWPDDAGRATEDSGEVLGRLGALGGRDEEARGKEEARSKVERMKSKPKNEATLPARR